MHSTIYDTCTLECILSAHVLGTLKCSEEKRGKGVRYNNLRNMPMGCGSSKRGVGVLIIL